MSITEPVTTLSTGKQEIFIAFLVNVKNKLVRPIASSLFCLFRDLSLIS